MAIVAWWLGGVRTTFLGGMSFGRVGDPLLCDDGEMRDPYTAGHERRVAEIAVAIGAENPLLTEPWRTRRLFRIGA